MENKQQPTSCNLTYETPAIVVIELAESPKLLSASQTSRPDYESQEW
ncbi:MAG: hypothetical protein J6T60_15150 [Bacteroidales bacterium]|nr:hypothetical protein [Bacteroidales bacterium]